MNEPASLDRLDHEIRARWREPAWAPLRRIHAAGYCIGGTLLSITAAAMARNADGTRMPHRMHIEYLQQLYLHNQFANNKFRVAGRVVSMSDVRVPMYVLGTETDHVAPWKSVYKVLQLTPAELTFTLTSGGHNAGGVSGPQHPRRRFRTHSRQLGDKFMDPDTWMESTPVNKGSWWPHWSQWLEDQSTGRIAAPSTGAAEKGFEPLRDAPGEYVYG